MIMVLVIIVVVVGEVCCVHTCDTTSGGEGEW